MAERKEEPTSVQVNVRLPPACVKQLKRLADLATAQSECYYGVPDIIREALDLSFYELARKYGFYDL